MKNLTVDTRFDKKRKTRRTDRGSFVKSSLEFFDNNG